jgi:hypothetical protein
MKVVARARLLVTPRQRCALGVCIIFSVTLRPVQRIQDRLILDLRFPLKLFCQRVILAW